MKKSFIIIFIFSVFIVLFSVYFTFFKKDIRVVDFKEYEEVNVFSSYKDDKVKICYGTKHNCKNINYKIKGDVNTKKLGTYNLTYFAKYKGKSFSITKKIKVVDKEKPKLIVDGAFTSVCPNGKTDNVKITATDNYDGDITDKVEYKLSGNKIIYKVSDSSGNTTRKEFDAIIMDNEKPTIILNGETTIYLAVGSKYTEPGYVAIDNCDGDVTEQVLVKSDVDTSKPGTYYVSYSVIDEFKNMQTVTRTVKVFPKNNYVPGKVMSKVIYLTFDDGPGAYTARLLDILKKYDVKVTFFVTGYNDKYNDLLTREHNEGHTVALHSYTHNYATIYSSVDSYMQDLLNIQNKVEKYTGVKSWIIRFPGGSSNTVSRKYKVGIMSELTKKVEEIGFRYFDWTILSGDAGNTKDSNKIVQNVISGIKENKANVVLMHDIKSYTVDSVERIIEYGLSNGYTFAPLIMDSPVVHQKVNN